MSIRTPLLLLALFAAAPAADAQVFAVRLKTEKAEKKLKKHLVTWRGRQVIVGDLGEGWNYDPVRNQVTWSPAGSAELFVLDPGDPTKVPYTLDGDGERVPASRKNVLRIAGNDVERIDVMMRDETLPGLAREYGLRLEKLADLRAARDACERGGAEWSAAHVRLVSVMETLQRWLASTAFPDAAEDLAKDIDKEMKVVRKEALRTRAKAALDSVTPCEVPERLLALSQEISGGKDEFGCYESLHLRILYIKTLSDAEVEAAVRLGEELIEAFRAEFVDPYLDAEYPDFIPDKVFHEFLFVPEDVVSYEKYASGFYGASFTQERERRLAMSGGNTAGMRGVQFNTYWKHQEQTHLPGIVAHRLGHSLADLHYGQGRTNLGLDWLSEAVGYYLSFEHFGANTVTCFAFDQGGERYVKREREKKEEGGKGVLEGRRDVYNEVALSEGRPIEQLALRTLVEMDDPDLCKSWSFFDYVARKEGKAGQQWLRAAGKYATDRKNLIAKWREDAAAILGVPAGEAFDAIEERWRAFAESGQDVSGAPGRR